VTRRHDLCSLLLWYPQRWRDRYGDELVVLMEDTLGDKEPTPAFRWSIARAGLAQRARSGGWRGDDASAAVRVRAGALIVLVAWVAVSVGGAVFAKVSEHYDAALPAAHGSLAHAAWLTVVGCAATATIAILVGGIVAVPAFVRAVCGKQVAGLGGHLVRAVAATLVATVATAGLVAWAHTLTAADRDAPAWPYASAFLLWGSLMALAMVAWCALIVAVASRVTFTRAELAAEAALALVVAIAIVAITAATALWWKAMSDEAPWFFHGAETGAHGSTIDIRLLAAVAVMVVSAVCASYGVVRIGRSWSGVTAS
jgi:hypothetical protein